MVLIYINDLIHSILHVIEDHSPKIGSDVLQEHKVSEVLKKLISFKEKYIEKGEFPELKTSFDLSLFNTFRSYIDLKLLSKKTYFTL